MSLAVRGMAGNTLAAFGYGRQTLVVVVSGSSGGNYGRFRQVKRKATVRHFALPSTKKLEISGHEIVQGELPDLEGIVTRDLKELGKPKFLKIIQIEHAIDKAKALAMLEQRIMKEAKALREFERRLDEEFFILLVAIEEADEQF